MPRRPRVFVEGGIYHVYNRFARGAELFSAPEEAAEFIEILRKARDRDDLVKDPLIDVDGVLGVFGETVRAARRAYVRAVKGAREKEWRAERPGALPWWGREVDRPVEPVAPSAWADELGRSTGLEREPMGPEEFIERCCAVLGISPEDIAGRGKHRRSAEADTSSRRWGSSDGG